MRKGTDPIRHLEQAIEMLDEEIAYLEEQGHSGTWVERKKGVVRRLRSTHSKLDKIEEDRIEEVMAWRRRYEELSRNTDRLFLYASLFLDESALARGPLFYSLEDLERMNHDRAQGYLKKTAHHG